MAFRCTNVRAFTLPDPICTRTDIKIPTLTPSEALMHIQPLQQANDRSLIRSSHSRRHSLIRILTYSDSSASLTDSHLLTQPPLAHIPTLTVSAEGRDRFSRARRQHARLPVLPRDHQVRDICAPRMYHNETMMHHTVTSVGCIRTRPALTNASL